MPVNQNTLKKYRRMAKQAAKELCYPAELQDRIMEATTILQIDKLLATGRNNMVDYTVKGK